MAEAKPESKDQRRARLNREGKDFIKTGQEHLVTDQHRTAMEYFQRKRSNDNSRRKSESDLGAGGVTKRATGAAVPTTGSTAQLPVPAAQRDKAYSKLSKHIAELGQENPKKAGIASILAPSKRKNNLGAINEDSVHHASMGTLADHLSDKLEEADARGALHSRDSVGIDNALTQAYTALNRSNRSHDTGQVNDAKVHMESVAQNLHSAATQMQAKGVQLHPRILDAIRETAQGYISSKSAGAGAMPHASFEPPREKSKTISGPKRLDASKISGDALTSSEDSAWTQDSSFEPRRNEGHELMSRQIKDSLGY